MLSLIFSLIFLSIFAAAQDSCIAVRKFDVVKFYSFFSVPKTLLRELLEDFSEERFFRTAFSNRIS